MSVNNSTFHIAHLCLTVKTRAEWTASNPVLLNGEIAFESDTLRLKVGNGTDTWSALTHTDQALTDRLDALEALMAQHETLAQAQLLYLNAWTSKLEQEEAYQ